MIATAKINGKYSLDYQKLLTQKNHPLCKTYHDVVSATTVRQQEKLVGATQHVLLEQKDLFTTNAKDLSKWGRI